MKNFIVLSLLFASSVYASGNSYKDMAQAYANFNYGGPLGDIARRHDMRMASQKMGRSVTEAEFEQRSEANFQEEAERLDFIMSKRGQGDKRPVEELNKEFKNKQIQESIEVRVDISDLDKKGLLNALYMYAKPCYPGSAVENKPLTDQECTEALASEKLINNLKGRKVSANISGSILLPFSYNFFNGPQAAENVVIQERQRQIEARRLAMLAKEEEATRKAFSELAEMQEQCSK